MRHLDRIVLHHSASKSGSHTWADIAAWHTLPKAKGGKHGFTSIGYHFGVVNDGNGWEVKVGRPVEQIGAHAKGFNSTSIGICFEGNFEEHQMPQEQLEVGIRLIARLVEKHKIALDNITMHRGLMATKCPGKWFPFYQIKGGVTDRIFGDWPV